MGRWTLRWFSDPELGTLQGEDVLLLTSLRLSNAFLRDISGGSVSHNQASGVAEGVPLDCSHRTANPPDPYSMLHPETNSLSLGRQALSYINNVLSQLHNIQQWSKPTTVYSIWGTQVSSIMIQKSDSLTLATVFWRDGHDKVASALQLILDWNSRDDDDFTLAITLRGRCSVYRV